MPYLVKDTQLKGTYDSSGTTINVVRYEFEVDTESDLPTQTQFLSSKNIKICMTSTAHVISNNKTFEMQSDGTWVDITEQSGGGTVISLSADNITYDNTESGMTATNVQDAIDEIHELDEMQERALAELYAEDAKNQVLFQELINGGAKNNLHFDGIGTKSGNSSNIDFTYNSDGSVTVNGSVDDSGNAYVYLQLNGSSINANGTPNFCNGDYVLSGCPTNSNGLSLRTTGTGYTTSADTGSGVEINEADSGIVVRIAVLVAKGNTVNNLTVRPMICTKSQWGETHTYIPYSPTNAELQETKQDKLSSVDRDLIRSLVYGNGFDLAPTSENQVDFNDLTTPGKYRTQSAVETDYVTNNSERRAGALIVEYVSSSGYIRQTWIPSLSANDQSYFCSRHYRTSGSGAQTGWSSWYKFEGTLLTT